MKIAKNAENADLFKSVDSQDFKERDKYDDAFENSMAVKFEIRFPPQPPMPTQPAGLKESQSWTAKKKRIHELTFIDWEWIRLTYLKNVQAAEKKRIQEREEQVAAVADQDLKLFYENQMNEQKFRILMTWVERFRTEKNHRQLRLQEHSDFLDYIRERRTESQEILRIEKFLLRRKTGLESPVPPPPVIYSRDLIKEELMVRHELAQRREHLSEVLIETLHQAQIQTASILLKQQLDLQISQQDQREETVDNIYIVNKIKGTKR